MPHEELLSDFPEVNAAFGYGSGIFAQPLAPTGGRSTSASRPMLDFIFAVRCPLAWHEQVSDACVCSTSCTSIYGTFHVYHRARRLDIHSLLAQNIQMNRGHYSCLASLGPGAVSCSSCLPDHVREAHVDTLHLTLAPQAIGDAD